MQKIVSYLNQKTAQKPKLHLPDAPNKIKVAIGMRRAGKTYFLYQQILKMLGDGVSKTSILYINFEDDRLLPLNEQKLANSLAYDFVCRLKCARYVMMPLIHLCKEGIFI